MGRTPDRSSWKGFPLGPHSRRARTRPPPTDPPLAGPAIDGQSTSARPTESASQELQMMRRLSVLFFLALTFAATWATGLAAQAPEGLMTRVDRSINPQDPD